MKGIRLCTAEVVSYGWLREKQNSKSKANSKAEV
jgi:hypothetical protein